MKVIEALAFSNGYGGDVDGFITYVLSAVRTEPIGIFEYLDDMYVAGDNPLVISLEYYLNRSGNKQASRLYEYLVTHREESGAKEEDRTLVEILVAKYRTKWNELYALLDEEAAFQDTSYFEDIDTTGEDVDIKTYTDDGKVDTYTASKIVTTDIDKVSAYNSNTFQNSASVERTEQANADDNTSANISHNTGDSTVRTQYGKSISKRGRNMPHQDLVEKELELRKKNYYDIIFKDIDSVLTKPMYL